MWKELQPHRLDLQLIQLNQNGTFFIPILGQQVSGPTDNIAINNFDLKFEKTSDGRELRIFEDGQLAKILLFDGVWKEYLEREELEQNFSTPIPGAKRKQLSLGGEDTERQKWEENYKFRELAAPFLRKQWAEADEKGVIVPGVSTPGIEFVAMPFVVAVVFAVTVFCSYHYFIGIERGVEQQFSAIEATALGKAKSEKEAYQLRWKEKLKQIKEANQRENGRLESVSISSELTSEELKAEYEKLVVDSKVSKVRKELKEFQSGTSKEIKDHLENFKNKELNPLKESVVGKSGVKKRIEELTNELSKLRKREEENRATLAEKLTKEPVKKIVESSTIKMEEEKKTDLPRGVERKIPTFKWSTDASVLAKQVNDNLSLPIDFDVTEGPVAFYYHLGKWEEGKSKLIKLEEEKTLVQFEIKPEYLVDKRVDRDGFRRGTVAAQVIVTNGESPYDKETGELIEQYRDVMIHREKSPLRVFLNKKPVFKRNPVVLMQSGKEIVKDPRNLVFAGGRYSMMAVAAVDPDGDDKKVTIQIKQGDKWQDAGNGLFHVDSGKSGHYKKIVRAIDSNKRISEEFAVKYEVNFPPKLKGLTVQPSWPVPGGDLRFKLRTTDPERNVVFESVFDENGKKLEKRKDGFYYLESISEGKIKLSVQLKDSKGLSSRKISKSLLVKSPKPVPKRSGKSFVSSFGDTFVEIPAGEFAMGSPRKERGRFDDELLHGVRITKPFFIQETEVTYRLYAKYILRKKPDFSEAVGKQGVRFDNKKDIELLCNTLNLLPEEMAAGRKYRLPTEAEWEYACKAGTSTPYNFSKNGGRVITEDEALVYDRSKRGQINHVKLFGPNQFGLYDTHGSTGEVCADIYDPDFYWISPTDNPSNLVKRPSFTFFKVQKKQSTRDKEREFIEKSVIRGGCLSSDWQWSRSATRRARGINKKHHYMKYFPGVRLVCEIGKPRTIGVVSADTFKEKKHFVEDETHWRMEDGFFETVGQNNSYENYKPGYIISNDVVTDFELECDIEIGLTRAQDKDAESSTMVGVVLRGLTAQKNPVKFRERPVLVYFGAKEYKGVIGNDITIQKSNRGNIVQKLEQIAPGGEKNTLKIRCVGKKVVVWVNGLKTQEVEMKRLPPKGCIGFVWKTKRPGYSVGPYKKATISNVKFKPL